ncbi:MAG: acetyl-CoA carboxylase, biotin carboxyl carrier protein [Elusimicrobia bacterium HGW-Elusimicrobia-1]|jgi:acetyl-CoA carboxylase biotin carboxyl carrier protein|nr:MAG: acetyl-CoA carboxylase, biotin carboxyl carrier protein [Elusimicrobia bacterium HGW-Elusimicrobia-1]
MSDVKEILKVIKDTDIAEIRVESGSFKFAAKRDVSSVVVSAGAPPAAAPEAAPPAKKRMPIKSPMVGTFFNAPAPDRPPLVIRGNHVEYSQKVGVVEAMKIFKDVVSPVKGVIVEVLVENNTPVEYGKELFLVETEE